MSNDELNLQEDLRLSDDGSDPLSVNSRLSADSGIEDWNDDNMTVPLELPIPLEEKQDSSLHISADTENLFSNSVKLPVETSIEYAFPTLPNVPNPAIVVKQDQLDDNGIPGVCGLYNLGNTCFMNAALQCLLCTSVIRDALKVDQLRSGEEEISTLDIFIEKLKEIHKKVSSGSYSILYADTLHSAIGRLHPGFADFKQHDSQEFISFVLNAFHDSLNITSHQRNEKKTLLDLSDSITGEVSKRLKMETVAMETEQDAGVECEENLSAAERAWREYYKGNQSTIVDGMHGQFQSVITCEKCSFVSTTHEPFMFLSLPIPYAMEMQIVVTWVPAPKPFSTPGSLNVKRYLVTVGKNGLVENLRKTFIQTLKKENDTNVNFSNIVFAEVKNCANIRVIDDKTQLKYLAKNMEVYALEVYSAVPLNQDQNSSFVMDTDISSATSTWHSCDICFEEKFEEELRTHRSCNGILCSVCLAETLKFSKSPNGDFPCPKCTCYIPDSDYTPMLQPVIITSNKLATKNAEESFSVDDATSMVLTNPDTGETDACVNVDCGDDGCSTDVGGTSESKGGVLSDAMKWSTCSICLEEIFDTETRRHEQCGGVLCTRCLSTLVGMNDHKTFSCPTCSRSISGSDYVPVADEKKDTKSVRQLLVPVLFRHRRKETSATTAKKFNLFGHPLITCFLSEMTSSELEASIGKLLEHFKLNSDYELVITDSSGLSCGMCDVTASCSGCRVKKLETIQLKPGFCVTLNFEENFGQIVKTLSFHKDDESVKLLRPSDVVTLAECLESFAEIEILTEDNPWYCPQCKTNQVSAKIMTVTHWPEILIVHLKRFHFEGAQGSKISCPIDFPLCDLNVDILTSADGKTSVRYDLYGCVNHIGSLFGGHYTAFTCGSNVLDGKDHSEPAEWYYFNDESYVKRTPPEDSCYQKEAYVLFYRMKK